MMLLLKNKFHGPKATETLVLIHQGHIRVKKLNNKNANLKTVAKFIIFILIQCLYHCLNFLNKDFSLFNYHATLKKVIIRHFKIIMPESIVFGKVTLMIERTWKDGILFTNGVTWTNQGRFCFRVEINNFVTAS